MIIARTVLALVTFGAAAHAQAPVGLLSFVSGDAQIVRSGQQNPTPARTADLIAAGDRVITGTGEVTFLFCPQSKTAKLGSGAEIEFAATAYTVKKGTVSGEKQVPSCRLPATLTLASASNVQSGMLRLRGASLLLRSPSRTNTATLQPQFEWEPVERAQKYEVRVLDREERVLWRSEVTGTSVEYPADATALQWGQRYRWRVTARDASETLDEATTFFSVLPAEQAQDVRMAEDSLRAMVEQNPEDNWPRFLLAFLYEERGMLDQAARLYYDLDQKTGTQPWVEGRLNELMNKLGWVRPAQ
jgi:hypothetical protein